MKYNYGELNKRHEIYFVKLARAAGITGWGEDMDITLSMYGIEIDVMEFLDTLLPEEGTDE